MNSGSENGKTRAPRGERWRRVVPAVATALLVPLFIGLGVWQLGRAHYKQELQEEYDARARGGVVRIEPRPQAGDDLRFYRVEVRGVYEPAHQFLLDNRVLHGQPGYHVITPLKIEGGELRVLVNRGWVPWGESRERLPPIATPAGPVTVHGIATVPTEKGFRLRAVYPRPGGGTVVWPYLDMGRYAAAVPFGLQPVIVLLDPESPAGGFTREWSRLDAGIAVHQGYAFQWFALAAALIILYYVLRRRRRSDDTLTP